MRSPILRVVVRENKTAIRAGMVDPSALLICHLLDAGPTRTAVLDALWLPAVTPALLDVLAADLADDAVVVVARGVHVPSLVPPRPADDVDARERAVVGEQSPCSLRWRVDQPARVRAQPHDVTTVGHASQHEVAGDVEREGDPSDEDRDAHLLKLRAAGLTECIGSTG